MKPKQREKSKKLRRRAMVQAVAVEFRERLDPRPPEPKMIVRQRRRTVPHYELAMAAVNEFIDVVGEALSQSRTVKLRGFGNFVPRRYKPMTGRLPGAHPDDKDAVFTVPVRLGILFQPSLKFKKTLREHDEQHGLPTRQPGSDTT